MHRTSVMLADGRELFYFDLDGSPAATRDLPDPRDLPPVATRSQMRWDPLVEEWVMMAAHRNDRTFRPTLADCPLCPSSVGHPSEVPAEDYTVAVFENRFPSLTEHASPVDQDVDHPLVPVRPGRGRCEVVCFSSRHDARFADLSPEHAELVLRAWADRTRALAQLPGVEQVFCFESRGHEIGVTLSHPHGQVYAYPFVTPRMERVRATARRHHERTGGHLIEDVLAGEVTAGTRVVADSTHWVAYVPAAARWPVEVHLHPRRSVRTLAELEDSEMKDLATVYLDLLARLDRLYDAPLPYIAAWHQGVVHDPEGLDRLHLQLFSIRRAADKLKYLAGSESDMGAFITDALPEDVAARLRAV